MHGDAAFAGQGIVYETLQLSGLKNFSTGGTIHIIINNQIGLTATPKDGRSTLYCTDIAKCFDSPVFHVRSDDPELVIKIFNLALQYRMKFNKDVFVDLVGFRYLEIYLS